MARTADTAARPLLERLLPNEALAAASAVLAMVVIVAVVRGQADWARVPPLIWLHLGSILLATAITPVMLLRRKGDRDHRRLGYLWVAAMALTAATSLCFSTRATSGLGVFTGDFSFIHILSVWTLIQVPLIVFRARAHDRRRHEIAVRGMVFGALLVAGFFTFPFDRMLGRWLLG